MVARSVLLAGLLGLAGLGWSANAIMSATPAADAAAGATQQGLRHPGDSASDQQTEGYALPENMPEHMPAPTDGAWELLFRSWR
jgi:hypothetical protein